MVADPAKTKRNCYSDVDNRWGKRYWHKITRRAGKKFVAEQVMRVKEV